MSAHPYRARPVGATTTWLTPPEIIDALGPFELDPCAAPDPRPWNTAKRHITLPEDGLTAPWEGRVWLNPPYGRETAKWLNRMFLHGNGIALVFARTDTEMFHKWIFSADGCYFLRGRPHFHYPDGTRAKGNSGGPMVLVAYGEENAACLDGCDLAGYFL